MNMLKGKIQAFLYICIENYNFQIVILIFLFFLLYEFKYSIKFDIKIFVRKLVKFYTFQKILNLYLSYI